VGRIEESRGPNSILFGVGSAGGIINFATKQPLLGRRLRSLLLAVSSDDSRRSAVDLNQPLASVTGAVHFNAVWDRSNTFRHHAFSESRRVHLAGRYRPTSATELRVEFERATVKANVPRTGALYDRSLPWIEAGRPTFAASAEASEFADIGTRLGALQLRHVSNLDRLLNLAEQILTTVPGPPVEITDPRHVDRSINTGGPGQVLQRGACRRAGRSRTGAKAMLCPRSLRGR
jgi:outer membrane receptor protein involved in Fe transport